MRNPALHRLLGLALLTLVPVTAHAQQAAQAAPLRGDVNGDGRVTAADAQAVRDHVAGRPAAPGILLLPNGDANGDGRITGVDAAMIQAFAAGRDVSRFGVGQPIRGGAGDGEQKKSDNLLGLHVCTVDVETNTQSCETPRPEMGASADYLLGKPHVTYVTTGSASSRGSAADEDTTSMNVAVTNNIGQPIGTTDGTNAAASGVRVFFHDGPRVTAVKSGALASATIRLEGTDGTANFAGPEGEFAKTGKPFYQYNGVLTTGATSAPRAWRFVYSASTKTFTYSVQVSAPVQFEFGKINITPASLVLGESEASAALVPTVLNPLFATVADGVTWSSSDPAVATVNAAGVVTGVAQGTATITATSLLKSQRKGSIPVTVDKAPTLVSTSPADNATQVAGTSNIEITFSEPVDVTTSSFTLECPAATAKTFAVSGSGTAVITLNPDADLPAGTICTVKVIGSQVSDSDTNDGPNNLAGGDRTFSFEVNIQAVNDAFGTTTTGNVRINSATASPAFSVTANDQLNPANTTITFAGWNGVAGETLHKGNVVMTASGEGMGQFTYNPPAGFEGTDSLEYTITSGSASASAKVALPVSGMIWFVNNTGAACTSRANGCGRLTNPYSTLAAFQAENNGTGNNPAANEPVFVYQSTTPYVGPVTLQNGQKLIGQDATATLQALSGITPAAGSDPLPAMDPAGDAATIAGTDGVNLGTGNMLRGLTLAPTAGEAIGGSSFGTLTLSTGTPDLTINAGGQALSLTTGVIAGTFTSVASAGGTHNVLLSGVTGDIDFGAGALSGSTGGAIKIVGGPLTLDASGNITQAAAAPLLDVSGTHTGTLTFTGTLNATAGTGLQFSDADGSYSFAGTTTLNGGDAGIDITAGSGGTFAFASGTAVTNPSGTAFRVAASTPGVTFNGNLTKNGASPGLLVDISGQASGTITFASGTLSSTSTAGTGIQLSDADGTVSFNGTTTLSGGDNGVDVIGGSTGAITFKTGTTITNPSGIALRVFNGGANTNVTFEGNLSTNAGRPVHVEGVSGGTVAVSGTITATGQGLLAQNNTGGAFSFTNATKTFNTTTNAAVTLSSNTGATVSFTNGLAITTTAGAGINASGGGNLTVNTGTNTISTGSGTALSVDNTTIAPGGLNFRSIAANGAANGIFLNNTGSTGSLTVSGVPGTAGSGGTIQNTTGADGSTNGIGVYLNNTMNPSLSWMQLNDNAGWAVKGITVSGLAMNKIRVTGVNGTDAGTDEGGVHLTGLSGSASITNSRIEGGVENNLLVFHSSGVLNRLTLTGDTIGANSTALGDNGISLEATGGTMNVTVQNSVFTSARARNFKMVVQTAGVSDLIFSGNTLSNNHPNTVTNGGSMDVAVGGSGSLTYLISGNTMRDSKGTALYLGKQFGGSFGNGTLSGTVSGNTIGVAGVANSGSLQGSAIEVMVLGRGFHRTMIQGNQLRGYNNQGILISAGGASEATTGLVHDAVFDVTAQNNVIAEPGNNPAISASRNGLMLNGGTNSGDDYAICLNLSGNTVTSSGRDQSGFGNAEDYRLRQRQNTTVRLPGYGGGTTDANAVHTYLVPRTTGAFTSNVTAASNGFTGGAACTTP